MIMKQMHFCAFLLPLNSGFEGHLNACALLSNFAIHLPLDMSHLLNGMYIYSMLYPSLTFYEPSQPNMLNCTPDGVTYILVSNRVFGRHKCTLLRATSTTVSGSFTSLLQNWTIAVDGGATGPDIATVTSQFWVIRGSDLISCTNQQRQKDFTQYIHPMAKYTWVEGSMQLLSVR